MHRSFFCNRLAATQQPERLYRVGWLDSTGTQNEPYQIAFVQRLGELGFAEGRNLVIEFRTTKGRNERMPELAADLVRQKCDVLLAPGTEAGLVAVKRASRNTPIVMVANDYDPVATGHVASLARPGGRVTGVSQLQSELPAKRLELLKEVLPKARRVAVFSDGGTEGQLKSVQAGATRLGVTLQVIALERAPYDYEPAFAAGGAAPAGGGLTASSPGFIGTDLSGHHPVSIEVNNALINDKLLQCRDGQVSFRVCNPIAPIELRPTSNLYAAGPHTGLGVQCSTCHDPHDDPVPGSSKFLRLGTVQDASPLCTKCHLSCGTGCP